MKVATTAPIIYTVANISSKDFLVECRGVTMDIIVCVKQSVDLDQIRIDSSMRKPMLDSTPLEIEALSKNAVEEALKIKEKYNGKVIAISVAMPSIKKTIKEVLAMGAEEAIILTEINENIDTMTTAQLLAKMIAKITKFDLIILGEGSGDNYSSQIGPRLAEILNLPAVTFAREISFEGNRVRCVRDLEDCYEVLEVEMPAIITVTNEINEPRLPSLSDILKASKKPLHEWKLADIGISSEAIGENLQTVKILQNLAPSIARKNITFEGELEEVVDKLIASLLKEGVMVK